MLGQVAPCGCPVGTTVEVHNLFFNTPVRRKFLRTTATEFGHVSEAFTRIALAAPHVHFTLRHNDKPVFELAAGDGWLERIALFFGRELAENLIWVESVEDDVTLSGYAAHPSQSRSHNRMQYFFLNGRHIRDRALQHALGEAYRGLLMVGRQPIAFLAMKMPPELVDVNAITHLRLMHAKKVPGQSLRKLAEYYLQRWPTCLQLSLILANAQMEGGEPDKAVSLLHKAASRDNTGQVISRLWGDHHPYLTLWPEHLEIELEITIPAEVAAALGWNQLPESTGAFFPGVYPVHEYSGASCQVYQWWRDRQTRC